MKLRQKTKYKIYVLTNPLTGMPCYVGCTININKRISAHKRLDSYQNTPLESLKNYLSSIGKTFLKKDMVILLECDNVDAAYQGERNFIYQYRKIYDMLNVADGGLGKHGVIPSLKTREKMSLSKLGNTNSLGYAHTNETRKKMSESLKGNKNAIGNTGWKYWVGRKHSKEHIKNSSIAHQKKINQFNKDMAHISTWCSATKAGDSLDIDRSAISKCLKGKANTAGGFYWTYVL